MRTLAGSGFRIRVENKVVVNRGPDVRLVQRASGRRIEPESIENVPRVSPARRTTRADLRVDAAGTGTRLRATEPISEKRSEGAIGRGRDDARDPRFRDREPRPTRPQTERPVRRFSPSADPQAPPESDTGAESADRGRFARQAPGERQAPPDRRNPRRRTNDAGGVSSDHRQSPADADTRTKDDARTSDDARAKDDAREKPRPKKPKPRPTPPDDKPSHQ